MGYFEGLFTVGDVKSRYRALAKANHPDQGGVTAVMQAINAAYHAALAALDGQENIGSDGKRHVYRYDHDVEQEVMDKVMELLGLHLPGVEIEIVGTWVWVSGDTKPVREQLKAAGLRWHSKRQRWYWRRFTYRRHYSGASFETLRRMYSRTTAGRQWWRHEPLRAVARISEHPRVQKRRLLHT